MGASCINLTCRQIRKKPVLFLSFIGFLAQGSAPPLWGWLWHVAACLALALLALLIYMEMDQLTRLHTSFLSVILARTDTQLVQPTHISVCPWYLL